MTSQTNLANQTRGVLFCAYGKHYMGEVLFAAQRIRMLYPELPIVFITDHQQPGFRDFPLAAMFDDVIHMPYESLESTCYGKDPACVYNISGYLFKIRGVNRSPFDRTLFMDTDTYVVDPCLDSLFGVLDKVDLAIAHQVLHFVNVSAVAPVMEMNTGMIVYSRGAVPIMEDWEQGFRELKYGLYGSVDQTYFQLSYAKYLGKIHTLILSPEYNVRPETTVVNPIRILHDRSYHERLPVQHYPHFINTVYALLSRGAATASFKEMGMDALNRYNAYLAQQAQQG
ncbi:response regulator receiver protein [Magnetococcus marinus MC-1]|uniref:Response regulator receiver protein n=1 Tax=Magnetococcus marinus (strain ATCC BAA-1437 / JCM 17883 / MC-1) TaxID=156889 RepID=A0L7M1_MAGMM|nr:response regulator [Magnetococcus marinus]ABK43964.1 response regulator receiver protein [Magnetococcus marinus MC-1]